MGITSRLLKSQLAFSGQNLGPHVNNLVRIEGEWYLLDVTNPGTQESTDPKKKGTKEGYIYLKKIKERKIDLNRETYTWNFPEEQYSNNIVDQARTYTSRNNMFYRIRKYGI